MSDKKIIYIQNMSFYSLKNPYFSGFLIILRKGGKKTSSLRTSLRHSKQAEYKYRNLGVYTKT